jgi:hypothetical protein
MVVPCRELLLLVPGALRRQAAYFNHSCEATLRPLSLVIHVLVPLHNTGVAARLPLFSAVPATYCNPGAAAP